MNKKSGLGDKFSIEEFCETIKVFSLAPNLRILAVIYNSPTPICEIELAEILEIKAYNLSRYLTALRRVGLVNRENKGRYRYFSINSEGVMGSKLFYQCLESIDSEEAPFVDDCRRYNGVKLSYNCDK